MHVLYTNEQFSSGQGFSGLAKTQFAYYFSRPNKAQAKQLIIVLFLIWHF